ncbi:MAG TPA: hypothetical protein VGH86_05845 [Phenylobacterium sp.]|jgi:hypothetical protein
MIQSGYNARRGPILTMTPNHRQLIWRRRLVILGAVLALALASGLVGSLRQTVPVPPPATNPFSYFPSQ